MMQKTNIPWTDYSWNPSVGCENNCSYCYARKLHNIRHKAYLAGKKLPIQYAKPFEEIQLFPDRLQDPLHKRKPCKIFVGSVADLFSPSVPYDFQVKVFQTMEEAEQHTFQILTKRPKIMLSFMEEAYKNCEPKQAFLKNVWLGVTAENQEMADKRIPILLQIPAAVRFVSIEPMLGEINLGNISSTRDDGNPDSGWGGKQGGYPYLNCLTGREYSMMIGKETNNKLDQIILGGESGPRARPMHPDWARGVRDQCVAAGVPFFFKQWGEWAEFDRAGAGLLGICNMGPEVGDKGCILYRDGTISPGSIFADEPAGMVRVGKKKAGRLLDGREWNEYPEAQEAE